MAKEWYDPKPLASATPGSSDQKTWSNENVDPLQDLLDWTECVDYDPLKDETLSIVELEFIIDDFRKKPKGK